jgi:CheY-like chemotaxis protein
MPANTILIVDDEMDIRAILRRLFRSHGFYVCEAANGREALAAAACCAINVIMLDHIMPEFTGAEVLRHLRGDPRFVTTPMIIMTDSPVLQPHTTPMIFGSTCVFTKPLNLDQVVTTVAQMLLSRVPRQSIDGQGGHYALQ